jgi:hypothetical protein
MSLALLQSIPQNQCVGAALTFHKIYLKHKTSRQTHIIWMKKKKEKKFCPPIIVQVWPKTIGQSADREFNKRNQKSMRYRKMRLTLSRVRRVTRWLQWWFRYSIYIYFLLAPIAATSTIMPPITVRLRMAEQNIIRFCRPLSQQHRPSCLLLQCDYVWLNRTS